MEKIFMAGAPVSAAVIKKLSQAVPNGTLYTPYGATEALPVTLVSASEIAASGDERAVTGELGTFVGNCIPQVECRVISAVEGPIHSVNDVQALKPYEIGEIIVRGDTVSQAYFNLSAALDSGKISDGERPHGDRPWHRMGDLGYLNSKGALYFCGRKVHAVRHTDGLLKFSIPTEMVFNRHPRVKRSALVDLGSGRGAGIVIEPYSHFWPESEDQQEVFRRELLVLAAENPITQRITEIFFHRAFPVDARHNAKIYRDRLGEWARSLVR
jgi:acyl-CoA synthetase (AMP-forming)/AMP-acid ligase II